MSKLLFPIIAANISSATGLSFIARESKQNNVERLAEPEAVGVRLTSHFDMLKDISGIGNTVICTTGLTFTCPIGNDNYVDVIKYCETEVPSEDEHLPLVTEVERNSEDGPTSKW